MATLHAQRIASAQSVASSIRSMPMAPVARATGAQRASAIELRGIAAPARMPEVRHPGLAGACRHATPST
jgi:hypothetical protein